MFIIPVLYNSVIHCFHSNIGTPDTLILFISMYTCGTNLGNLSMFSTSWSMYLFFATHPKMIGRIVTPSMHGSAIVTYASLRGDLSLALDQIWRSFVRFDLFRDFDELSKLERKSK